MFTVPSLGVSKRRGGIINHELAKKIAEIKRDNSAKDQGGKKN